MSISKSLKMLAFISIFSLASCTHPISMETRSQLDAETTFAKMSEAPSAFLDQQFILGGVVISLEEDEEGSTLEVMEWQLNRWGEPTYLDDEARRFLVKSTETLDPNQFEPGVLITLAGVVLGEETRLLDQQEYNYPVLDLTEIHLWRSPFRYGIHRNVGPAVPHYVAPDNEPDRHPYDPGYSTYPYTPYWYRDPH